MQFTGHPLPVHQFVTVPWDFNPVQYCQPSSPTPTEYASSAVFGMACLAGSEVNTQQGHCWRSEADLGSDLLLWNHSHGRAMAGRPARTYIQQLCANTGCSLEDLPEAMDDRNKW